MSDFKAKITAVIFSNTVKWPIFDTNKFWIHQDVKYESATDRHKK